MLYPDKLKYVQKEQRTYSNRIDSASQNKKHKLGHNVDILLFKLNQKSPCEYKSFSNKKKAHTSVLRKLCSKVIRGDQLRTSGLIYRKN